MDLSSQSLLYGCRGQIYSPRNYFKYKEANCQGPIRATHRSCRELSVQFSLVVQSCLTLCDPMNCSMPGRTLAELILVYSKKAVGKAFVKEVGFKLFF